MELFVLGPASSGKSSFTKNFSEFLRRKGYSVACVNLDIASPSIYSAKKTLKNSSR